jgi:hypothetical protein
MYRMSLLFVAFALACSSRQLPVGEPAPADDFDQQGWEYTSPYGSGEEVGSGYYGSSHASAAPPDRAAAEPELRERRPAVPR